mmetsp:Transcript_16374/g.28071  ORF Transcript_16374/g.28071 Transcript_16374/m.28071 type:complete len:434 (+) Transcript_16374:51-1352(+)
MDDEEAPQLALLHENTPAAVLKELAATGDHVHRPVPVCLITGFLGSGKTSLVRHILSAPHGLRIAVILNEYGEGVEQAYWQDIKTMQSLQDKPGEWIELENGCMCCSVKSEFVLALETLMAKEKKPDYILIETTGMANPGPVAAALWTDEEIEAGVQLDSIITVVDGLNIDRQLHAARSDGAVNEAQAQIAYADLVLLNKMDLCGEEAITMAEAEIKAINSSVHIVRTTNCVVDLKQLLNRHGYKHGAEVQLEPIAEGDDDGDEAEHGDKCGSMTARSTRGHGTAPSGHVSHSRGISLGSLDRLGSGSGKEDAGSEEEEAAGSRTSHKHHHDPQITTITLRSNTPLLLEKVKCFLDKLLWDKEAHPEEIFRAKGVLSIAGDDRKHMLQAVYELYNLVPSVAWLPNEQRVSRIVLIGRPLDKQALQELFDSTCA